MATGKRMAGALAQQRAMKAKADALTEAALQRAVTAMVADPDLSAAVAAPAYGVPIHRLRAMANAAREAARKKKG